ncbi:protein tyrosine phosphatase domain-containing protein 1 [Trichonephila inaurata madagascariensis]|uniref:Protein tyrosine phosphatase domain-containing protein 1 n=1 Tax=Trichonephila inaurata madagascariensis TaxID=2747483 RepID=A0A8X6MIE5_9ARAC|nr:protein tyrosine phosphatase domain-containing protein 1 [Trichonephila inaurata madagascariensis]
MSSDPKCNLADLKPVKFSGSHSLSLGTLPSVQYGIVQEKLRQSSSKTFHCSVFCPGKRCRYEGAAFWQKEDMPVMGLFSTWITDDIVTMARPSTEIIEKYKIIKQFREFGIKSLINLQERGEHSSCGVPLERSGFTYDPQIFMENKIFYYNFDWKDYGSVPKTVLLDMVKVLSFALGEGKVAIHSHAGLGRTGVLVACYLIYTLRCKPTDAVAFVRTKRPGSVTTKSQVESVQGFAQFVVPMFIVFANVIPRDDYRMSLNAYLRRQRYLLHGFEGRLLKHVPKPVFMFCERLLSLMSDNPYTNHTQPLDLEQLFNGPNRFLEFFSSKCRLLRIRFPASNKLKDKWTLQMPYMNGIVEEPRHCAPPSPPNGITGTDNRPFWDSPDSMSSPEDQVKDHQNLLEHIGSFRPHFESELDYRLSDDEETGQEPELEYNDKSLSNNESSNNYNVRKPQSPLESKERIEVEADRPNDVEGEEDGIDDLDDDPLEDLNSEECNAIIDSVLQECPTEQNTPYMNGVQNRRDIFANKDSKGCSTLSIEEECPKPLTSTALVQALLADHYALDTEFAGRLRKYQRLLNSRANAWDKIAKEVDPLMLSALLWSWLDLLREPVLNRNDLSIIVIRAEKPWEILKRLDNGTRYTTEYLVRFIARLRPKSTVVRDDLLRRLVASLTHQAVGIQGTLRPVGMEWNKLRQGTAGQLMLFIDTIYDMATGEVNDNPPGL